MASSSASVADSSEKTAPYTDPALANTAASWWYTNSPAHANTNAAADADPNSDTAVYPNPDSATNADSDAKADPDSSSNPDSPSKQAYSDAHAS